ncbi:N-formylglutamate amidohydrolase [Profundibacter sp.]|uniref:N-formylglutamate amidohydrolase n=1 Tax=Profundibacter sp. TaxID=3101071 RepID=UPI003D12909C
MSKATYQLELPENRTTSVIFASPHSGRSYPWAFLRKSVLDELAIRSSEDAFVDLLFADVPTFGAPLLSARAPRAFVDLNRSRDELDPAVIDSVPRSGLNPRVASGLGVIPRVVSRGRQIYRGKLSKHEADLRLTQYWQPYHDVLEGVVAENCRMFGQAVLIDCHSMPHEAIDSINRRSGPKAEVVLGDRYGAAANGDIVDRIEAAFVGAGLTVVRNMPFAGAYVAQHYGRPSLNRHAVQVEIDRSLYMNEKLVRPNANFRNFQKLITSIASEISEIGRREQPLAAE